MEVELDTLSELHSIRQELFTYNNSSPSCDNMKNLLELYIPLLPEDIAVRTYLSTLAKLQIKTIKTEFDLEKWRRLALEDESLRTTQNKMLTKENAKRSENNKAFKQESTFKQKVLNELRLKGCDVDENDLISLSFDGKKLSVNFSNKPVKTINVYKNGKKNVTAAFWNLKLKIDSASSSSKKKELSIQQKDFLSPTQLQTIIDNKGMTFTTEKQELISTEPAHKNITFEQYQKLAGSTEFIPNIEKEYTIYCKLSFINQEKFLEEIKLRKAYMDKSVEVFKELCNAAEDSSKLKKIANRAFLLDKLSETLAVPSRKKISSDADAILPTSDTFEKAVSEVLTDVIENEVKGETGKQHIWSNFSKSEKNPRYSPYEIFLDHAVVASQTIHSEIFNFDTPQQMRNNIADALSEIKSQQRLILPNTLAAEILCIGVFNVAMKRAQNEDDLAKMNQVLNEFGLNIRFEEREITKIPKQSSSNEYLSQERIAFRDDADHKSLTEAFDKFLEQKFGEVPHKKEVHHFIPLRYNDFIDEELNQSKNYVAVASQHEYNLDLHGLGHTFDTPSDTPVKDKDGHISLMTYAKMRAEGLGKTLLVPILQIETAKGFEDVLSNQTHKCISTDKTPICYVDVPEHIAMLMRERKFAQEKIKKSVHE